MKTGVWSLLTLLLGLTAARVINREIVGFTLRRARGWFFLDRMNVDAGEIEVTFSTELQTQRNLTQDIYQLELLLISNQLWRISREQKCAARKQILQAAPNSIQQQLFKIATVSLNRINNFKNTTKVKFNISSPQTYHIVFADCMKTMINEHFSKKSKLLIQTIVKNSGKNYGNDESIYSWFLPILVLADIAMLWVMKNKTVIDSDSDCTDWPRGIVKLSLWLDLASISCCCFDHLMYVYGSGEPSIAIAFVFAAIDPIPDCLVMALLTFVAYGWYIRTLRFLDEDIYTPIAVMCGLSYSILHILTKVNDFDPDKYHFHDNVASLILIGLRVSTLFIFYLGFTKYKVMDANTNCKLIDFKRCLFFVGSICFMNLPVIIFLSAWLQEGWQRVFVFTGLRASRMVILVILTYQLSHKKSAYRSVCLLDRSFMESDGKYL